MSPFWKIICKLKPILPKCYADSKTRLVPSIVVLQHLRPPPKKRKWNSVILDDVFGCIHTTTDLKSEIHRYLNELAEPTETRILEYWHRKQDIYPSLSATAKCFLAIPATSASSERVFSKSKTIVGPQRASLSATSIEHTLCLKEWYRSTGNLDSLPYDEKDFDDDFGQPEYC
ncbi:hypothetical protein Pst134EB_001762 [Puccinia striiformis f. sp. tritici]|nr:hypothetical protein Pst134EB_001762 [Puccinia striiformis f. sp. tritici]